MLHKRSMNDKQIRTF